jgi:hypothetical protein
VSGREKNVLELAVYTYFVSIMFLFVIIISYGLNFNKLEKRVAQTELRQSYLHNPRTSVGKVAQKFYRNGMYTVTIYGYGNFFVDKSVYDNISVGDEMPKEIKERVEAERGVGG